MPLTIWKRTAILAVMTLGLGGLAWGGSAVAATAPAPAGAMVGSVAAPRPPSLAPLGCPTTAILPIHTDPGTAAPTVDWLVAGTCVSFDGRTANGRWARIAASETLVSQPGWVDATQLVLSAPLANLAVVSSLDLPGESQDSARATSEMRGCLRGVSALKIRLGPAVTYRKVDVLRRGECETLLGISPDRDWVKLSRGWVSLFYLTVDGDAFTLPVIRLKPRSP